SRENWSILPGLSQLEKECLLWIKFICLTRTIIAAHLSAKENYPMTNASVYRMSEISDRFENLEEGGTFIKPFVNTKMGASMAGGVNFLNNASIPWDLTCDELVYCFQGTFRMVVGDETHTLEAGDMMYVPKDNKVVYESVGKAIIFYAAYPVNWKELSGVTHVPGIDPSEMPTN
ncbi:MAG: ethanolamine utilization protein EutQ, partial [Gammaproteobacteria bacterium]